MNSTTEIALGVGGGVLVIGALIGGFYYMSKGTSSSDTSYSSPSPSRSSSVSSTDSSGSSLGSGWEDSADTGVATNLFANGGRRKKSHRRKLSKKKSKSVRRSRKRN